uniref:BTB domain-containing protein n=1 Tax=Rhabditophanes sp. KR3021 TaxID=114890 RepID=A0AC35U390_9BILA
MDVEKFPNLSKLLLDESFADAELSFSNGSARVLRSILAASCDYFYNFFYNKSRTVFIIDDISLADFRVYYKYLQESAEITETDIIALLNVQLVIKSNGLENKIYNFIKDEKNVAYIGILFEFTSKSVFENYHNLAKIVIGNNFDKLNEIHAFDSFNYVNLNDLFDQKFIKTKCQHAMLQIVTRWVDYDYKNRKNDWITLMTKLDFNRISSNTIKVYIRENPKISQVPELAQFYFDMLIDDKKHGY